MKTTALAALLVLSAAPSMAEDKAPATTEAESAAKAMTIDNSIEELMSAEATASILQKHIPGIDRHPAYDQFKGMSLVELKPWSAGAVTDEIIAAVTADLEALKG